MNFVRVTDAFKIDNETAAKVEAKVYKTIVEHGITPKTFDVLLRSFTEKELAYASFRLGTIYTIASMCVFDFDDVAIEYKAMLELAEQLSEDELVNYFVKRFKRADEFVRKLNESSDPQFI